MLNKYIVKAGLGYFSIELLFDGLQQCNVLNGDSGHKLSRFKIKGEQQICA